jgi:hypothetical protein
MPNIEIHGKIGREKEALIRKVLCVLGIWGDNGVITKMNSVVRSCPRKTASDEGVLMPFIRVCSTDPAEIEKIVGGLKMAHLGVDTEELVLRKFSSAKDMA